MLQKSITFMQSQLVLGVVLALITGLSVLWFWPPRGLVGEYYENITWTDEAAFSQRDKTFDLEAIHRQHKTFPHEQFSVRWSGWIRIDREGEYTFSLLSDDGSSLFLRNTLVIDNGGYHAFQRQSGTIFLSEGLHSLQVNYFQNAEDYGLKVFWTPPGKRESFIPPQVLYPKPFPIRGIGFISRKLSFLYPALWLSLLVILVTRTVACRKDRGRQSIRIFAQNVALSCATLIVLLLVLEGGFRIVFALKENRQDPQTLLQQSQNTEFTGNSETYSLKGMVQPSPNPNIVYELKPHLQGDFLGAPLTTNSRGLRDREYNYQKADDTFRIVGLGDSSMFGWGIRLEDSALKVLERKLNEHTLSSRYEVINFAVPGYNTAIEVEVFIKKCLKYSPDLVIMHFNTNDYDIPFFMKPPQSYSTLRKSYLADFVYARYQSLVGAQNNEVIPFVFDRIMSLEESDTLDERPDLPDEYRHMVGERGFIKALERLMEVTQSQGIPVLVYVVKSYPGLDPSYIPNEFRLKQLELITRLSQKMGFSLLNMYPAYIAYRQNHPEADDDVFWVSRRDSHPSAVAHRVEAEALYDFLVETELVIVQ